jgi:hypothetical protein
MAPATSQPDPLPAGPPAFSRSPDIAQVADGAGDPPVSMLTSSQPARRRVAKPRSLKQEYEEFILQRIEEFKEQLSRDELLAIADEAVQELELGTEDQLVLTEVLVLEHVDRLIMRRLRLTSYRRWRERHVRLRRAQREPTHWGLDAGTPLEHLAEQLDDGDLALVIGSGVAPAGLFLAALEVEVLLIDPTLTAVEAAEHRASAEALASRFQALVVSLGTWFPDVAPALAVLDPLVLGALDPMVRHAILETVKAKTVRGGAHLVLPSEPPPGVTPLAPEALQTYYGGWPIERARRGASARWFLARKP